MDAIEKKVWPARIHSSSKEKADLLLPPLLVPARARHEHLHGDGPRSISHSC